MKIVLHQSVEKFIKNFDPESASEILRVVGLLERYGHSLSMPHTKPIGNGLWELRIVSKRPLRVLYGFCGREAVLVKRESVPGMPWLAMVVSSKKIKFELTAIGNSQRDNRLSLLLELFWRYKE